MRFRQADRIQPELGDLVAMLDMDVRRLRSFQAVKEEAESGKPVAQWASVDLADILWLRSRQFNAPSWKRQLRASPKAD
jgi:hypothetical protein